MQNVYNINKNEGSGELGRPQEASTPIFPHVTAARAPQGDPNGPRLGHPKKLEKIMPSKLLRSTTEFC